MTRLTWNNSAGESGDALNLCDIIESEVFVTAGVELRPFTEERPELCGHRHVVYDVCFQALVKVVVLKRTVAQQTDSKKTKENF